MDYVIIITYCLLAILHCCGILYNIYAISLPEVTSLQKIQVFLLLISLMPVLSTDVIAVAAFAQQSSAQFDGLVKSFDVFAILSYHVFFTNYILGNLGQASKGFRTSFYPNYVTALVVKALGQPVIGIIGLSLVNLADNYYTSTFICCYHAIGLGIVSLFVLVLKNNLVASSTMSERRATPTLSFLTLNASSAFKSSHSKIFSVSSNPVKSDRNLQHICDYSKSLFTKTLINFVLAIVVLGLFNDGSSTSAYYISLSWKFTMGMSGILATKSTVDFNQRHVVKHDSKV